MERRGVRIDAAMLAQQSRELALRMHEVEQHAYRVAGSPFNLGSPKQIGEIFFERLGLPVVARRPRPPRPPSRCCRSSPSRASAAGADP